MNADMLMLHLLVAAKNIAPFDTGNLSLNSIQMYKTQYGYKLVYSGVIAPYVHYLENGTKYFDGHKNFIKTDTRAAMAQMVRDIYHGNRGSISMTFAGLAEKAKANPAINEAFLNQLRR